MRNFKEEIFKAYDIRGQYPEEINEEIAFFLGRSLARFLKGKRKKKKLRVAVGRDSRSSSPTLLKSLIQGLLTEKILVYDLGFCTSPMVYWASHFFSFDSALEITASHLPAKYNGFKIVGPGVFLGENTGLKKLKEIFQEEFSQKRKFKKKGKLKKKDIVLSYLDFNLRDFQEDFSSLKVVVDFGNSVPGILFPFLKKLCRIKIFPLFSEVKTSFSHPPDPTKKENLVFLSKEVKKRKADFGLAFDGDGDRVCFVDEKGRMIVPNLIFSLLIKKILDEKKGAKIVCDLRANRIVKETILKYGGKAIFSRVGHTFVKEKMKKEKALFAGESSAHYYHQKHFYCESPLFVFLKIAQIVRNEKKPLSLLIEPFDIYYSQELTLPRKEEILSLLEKK